MLREGPSGQDTACGVECALELAGDDGVEARIEALDPRDRRLDQLDRRDLSSHQFRLPDRVKPREHID